MKIEVFFIFPFHPIYKKKCANNTCKKHKYCRQFYTFSIIHQPEAKKTKALEKQQSNKKPCVFLPYFSCCLPFSFSISFHSRDTPFPELYVQCLLILTYPMFCANVSYSPEEYFHLHIFSFPILSKINLL